RADTSMGTSTMRRQRRHLSSTPPSTTRATRLPQMQRASSPSSAASDGQQLLKSTFTFICDIYQAPRYPASPKTTRAAVACHEQARDRGSVARPPSAGDEDARYGADVPLGVEDDVAVGVPAEVAQERAPVGVVELGDERVGP